MTCYGHFCRGWRAKWPALSKRGYAFSVLLDGFATSKVYNTTKACRPMLLPWLVCLVSRFADCSPQPGRCSTLTIVMIHDHDHDHHHRHHHHHIITSSHHHIMIIITLKFATPSEQYVDWGNNINFIFMKGSKFATPSEQYVDWGNNINFIFMRGQNSPPPLNNMLTGVITPTISPWGIKIRHPLWTICWLG